VSSSEFTSRFYMIPTYQGFFGTVIGLPSVYMFACIINSYHL